MKSIEFMKIYEIYEIYENPWKTMKIYENL